MSQDATARILRALDRRFGVSGKELPPLPDAAALARLLEHNTHRRYTATPVRDDLLDLLYAAALSAPSKSDLQQADIIRVRSVSKRQAIGRLLPDMPWVVEAPVFLVFCGNSRRIRRVASMRGKQFANDHLDAFFNATVDAGIVLATFIHAAAAAGLGACAISAIRNHAHDISDLLELPPWVFPVAGLCVGYPDLKGRIVPRLPLSLTTHTDRYDEGDFAAQIEAYDRRRDTALPYANQQLVELYGRAGFYGWSEDKARQYSEPMRADFGAYVRNQGFDLT
ncbi:MAG: nitroreductase family protein [Opitutaceae bacterium]|nr:nitroreductase family protein [Opitutaceae bacterium]